MGLLSFNLFLFSFLINIKGKRPSYLGRFSIEKNTENFSVNFIYSLFSSVGLSLGAESPTVSSTGTVKAIP